MVSAVTTRSSHSENSHQGKIESSSKLPPLKKPSGKSVPARQTWKSCPCGGGCPDCEKRSKEEKKENPTGSLVNTPFSGRFAALAQPPGKGPSPQGRHHNVPQNDPATAPPMSCAIANSSPGGISLDILFAHNSSTLTPQAIAAIDFFAANWRRSGCLDPVRVDGYASIEGPPSLNWPLSCDRAEALAAELMNPSSGDPGIPASFITVFANGETVQFSAALPPNRRAQAHIPAVPATQTITSRTVEVQPGLRTRTTIGVGELVDLTTNACNVTWWASAGTLGVPVGRTVRYTAPDTAQRVVITAGTAHIVFNVLAPRSVAMDREPGTGVKHHLNQPDSGIQTRVHLGPDTVNFSRIRYRELDVAATATGTYSCHAGAAHCGAGVGNPCPDKTMTNTVIAGMGTRSVLGDCAYSGHCGVAPPFVQGLIQFNIPYEYRVGLNPFRRFSTVAQVHHLLGFSLLTSSKAGAFGLTTVSAPTTLIAACP